MEDLIYLDFASKEPPLPCAIEAFLTAPYENPSAAHACGQAARNVLEDARARIAKCINAKPEEIIFTSGATEGSATVLLELYKDGFYIQPSPFEHHAVLENLPNQREDKILDTKAFATMLVNNETGTILEPKKGNEFQRLFCDLTAAVGHIPVDVKALGIDYGIFSAHKFGGVSGAGVVYVRNGAHLHPIIRGGGQERGMRAGTENVPAICAMASALEWQCEHMVENLRHVHHLYATMFRKLFTDIEDIKLNADHNYVTANISPYILNVSFPGVEGTALALYLSKMGVMVSTGAACSNGLNEPSHVLMAMYGDEARARSAIRISFSHSTTEDEVRIAAEKINEAVRTLRGL